MRLGVRCVIVMRGQRVGSACCDCQFGIVISLRVDQRCSSSSDWGYLGCHNIRSIIQGGQVINNISIWFLRVRVWCIIMIRGQGVGATCRDLRLIIGIGSRMV